MSRAVYRQLAKENPTLQREWRLEVARKEALAQMEGVIKICSLETGDSRRCSYRDALDAVLVILAMKLRVNLLELNGTDKTQLLKSLLQQNVHLHTSVEIIIRGDGHPVTRKSGQTQLAVNIVFGGNSDDAFNPLYYQPMVVYDGKEDYELTKLGFEAAGGSRLLELSGSGVDVLFCSDWKFEALFFGRPGPTAKEFCPHCCCNLRDVGSRLEERSTLNSWEGRKFVVDPVCELQPEKVVPDPLHLTIRIQQKLVKLFFHSLFDDWSNDLEELVVDEVRRCGVVDFSFYVQGEKRKWTVLTAKECERVMKEFNHELFVEADKAAKLKELWLSISAICKQLRSSEPRDLDELGGQITKFFDIFLFSEFTHNRPRFTEDSEYKSPLTMYSLQDVTPYMHRLRCHILHFVKKYGGIARFACDTLEMTNKQHRQVIQRGQKHRDRTRLVMEFHNRNIFWNFKTIENNTPTKPVLRINISSFSSSSSQS